MSRDAIANLIARLDLQSKPFQTELAKAHAKSKQFRAEASKLKKENTRVSDTFKRLGQSAAIAQGPLGSIAGRFTTIGAAASGAGAAVAGVLAVIAGLAVVTKKSHDAFMQMETGQLKTQAMLQATGSAAGKTAKQIEDLSRKLAADTLADVNGAREAAQIMLSFRNIKLDNFDRAMYIVADLSELLRTDLKGAALQIGKALEDPADGLTKLSRSGVTFTAQQEENIRKLQEVGKLAEAQAAMFRALEGQSKDVAKAASGGLAGKYDLMAQRWQEFLEQWGKTTGVADTVGGAIDNVTKKLEGMTGALAGDDSIDEMLKERAELVAEINRLQNSEDFSDRLFSGLKLNSLTVELYEIEQKITAERKAQTEEEKRQADARAAAIADRQRLRAEELAAQTAKAQKAGASTAARLDQELGTQQERLKLAFDKRKEMIEEMQLSQAEIEKRGFETLEQIRASYYARNLANYQEQLNALKEKDAKANAEKLQMLREQMEQETAARQQKNRFTALVSSGQMSPELANERQRHVELMAELSTNYMDQLALIGDNEALKAEALNLYREAERTAVTEHQLKLQDIEAQSLEQRQQAQQAALNMAMMSAQQSIGVIMGVLQSAGKEQSTAFKLLFAMQKAAAIPAMIVSTEQAATQALAAVPPPYNVPLSNAVRAMGYMSVGIAAGQAITGAREKGGEVKKGKTYLVGENGPELFTAGATGQITSRDNLERSLGVSRGTDYAGIINGMQQREPANASQFKIAGARAKGGPVERNRMYLVGEQGPEVVKMPGNGSVIPNNRLNEIGGQSGAQGAQSPAITIVNLVDPSMIADYMTQNGDELVINTIRNNPEQVKQAIN